MFKIRHNLIEPGDNEDITNERRGSSFRDPIPPEFMSRMERVENNARKVVAMTDKASFIDQADMFEEGFLIMGRDFHAMSLHYTMFIPTIQGQANDDQVDYWLPLALTRGIIGTYAQTELGHGTNISKLETTATYDEKTDEFVLHTPSVSATKWWSGGLGKSSNYAIIPAQLIINGSKKAYICITVGDIGPKMGIPGNDNGFLIFNNHRIPRKNMFMRYSQVLSNGQYIAPKHSKLRYGTMVFVRSIMVRDQAMQLAAAVTIAVRYSAVRRQGEWKSGSKEVQILDYRTQQYRIFPYLAQSFVFLFAATEVKNLYMRVSAQLAEGITELLQELHVLSSGFKAVVTWEVAKGIEQCRLACGGHGYSHASALPEIYAFAVAGCTYEGENIVMLLQLLMKTVNEIRSSNARLAAIAKYLIGDKKHIFDIRLSPAASKNNHSPEEAWNCASVELCQASRLHILCFMAKSYFTRIVQCSEPTIMRILDLIGKLYLLHTISTHCYSFRKDDYMSDEQIKNVKCGIYEILGNLRPDAVAIVDSFDFSDRELHSVLGRRDGNVYAAMLEWAKHSELNKSEVLSTFEKYLGPMMKYMEKPKDTAVTEQRPFVLKKWNALAMWSWDVECDICAICRVQIMDACLRCQSENKQDECVVVWGECNHSFHNCCMSLWVKQNNRCPLCQQDWQVQRTGH
ncbi:Acyl-coenzyme A oxidase [Dirofilaria immitis]|nr:Acyl-coenzyme A oxidase [Dirofilaria immitis]